MKKLFDCIMESQVNNEIFIIIKPGFLNLSGEIIKKFEDSGYEIKQSKTKKLLLSEAKELYSIHKNEDFYESLCKYMSSDLSTAFILKSIKPRLDIFKNVSNIKDEIRKTYGESDMRNVLHSSDSKEHMLDEMKIYFNIV